MFFRPSLDAQRQKYLNKLKAKPSALADFYTTPFAKPEQALGQIEFLAIDIETTGLNPKKDLIVSVGFVVLKAQHIILATSQHHIIKVTELKEESVVLHGISNDVNAQGKSLAEVMPLVLEALKGRIAIAHYATIEQGFLSYACEQLYGCALVMPIVDTLVMEQRRLERHNTAIKEGDLRLDQVRKRYALPRYRAHNALSDAIATAELFLSLSSTMADTKLKSILR